ncbi:MAG: NAD(P)/FAD-dependent oxidoreductase [Bacillota bacterium]
MIRLNQIKLDIFETKDKLAKKIANRLKINQKDIIEYKIFKESIDARRKKIKFVYTIDVKLKNEDKFLNRKRIKKTPDYSYKIKDITLGKEKRPIIIGAGPAGLFNALIFAQNGYKPIILEQGQKIPNRYKSIKKFWEEGILNESSNMQFGEGGAGTFSDGKLTTRIKDIRCRKVLKEFIEAGAPEEIIYKKEPHIGTDNLRKVIINIRKKIEKLGGTFKFNFKVTDFIIEDKTIKGIKSFDEQILSDIVVLAIGNSSRKTFEKLFNLDVKLKSKPFAIGARIEHPQHMIDKNQYGNSPMVLQKLKAANYKLTYNKGNRGVYTFCMCPGGFVVGCSSEKNMVVTNGMSEYARDQRNANSAILVNVKPEDFDNPDHPLSGIKFQRKLEKRAFELGGNNYFAPACTIDNFLNKNENKIGKVKPSYKPGVNLVDFRELLPDYIIKPMQEAIKYFDKKIEGFARKDAILTGIETRSSSPVRILRKDNFESVNIKGLFPIGEGSGYSGGIMSSAVDGIKACENILNK